MQQICKKEKCTGCLSCYNSCPNQAISFEWDNGFYYPKIDEKKCINCGLCKKSCPCVNKVNKNKPYYDIAYAVINNNKEVRDTSSSGGIFYNLAKSIIESNGIVFGAIWTQNLEVEHVGIESVDEIKKMQGSKYTQSNIKKSYIKVKEELKKRRKVLFSGVPCQIAGLITFLQKEYDNLYTCEVLCHGNASPKILKEHIKYIEKNNNEKIEKINFRYKTKEKCQNIEYKFSNGKHTIIEEPLKDYYYNGFQNGTLLRESCYQCDYIGIQRCADITLADFWGVNKNSIVLQDEVSYPSLVFINSQKGKELFEKNKNKWTVFERPIEEAVWGNLSLRRATPKSKWKEKFFLEYKKSGYENAAKKCLIEHKDIKYFIKKMIGKNATAFFIKVLKR